MSAFEASTKPWPPPPDIDSIQELVATADVEGFISEGAPVDEYETEADQIFSAVKDFTTAEMVATKLLPILGDIWRESFNLNDAAMAVRHDKLGELAGQIERFFGPAAQPSVRGASAA